MKIEIRETKVEGFVQVTTVDERWYINTLEEEPEFPSNTWICSYYPKGVAFMKWLAAQGWDEAEALKNAAGIRGSKIHKGIEILLKGQALQINDPLPDGNGNVAEPTVEEWEAIMSFADWWKTLDNPEILSSEQTRFCREPVRFGTTEDLKVKIGGRVTLIDFKSGQHIWPEYHIQMSAIKHCEGNEDVEDMGVLQVGYKLNKRGWKYTPIEDKWSLFLSVYDIWWNENKDVHPKQKDYPTTLILNGDPDAGANKR